jgi:hypothetical protein
VLFYGLEGHLMTESYTIQFESNLTLDRPFLPEHFAYLDRFVQTRRVTCSVEHLQNVPDLLREAADLPLGPEGAYFVGIDFDKEHIRKPIVLAINKPPQGQPSLWCSWRLDPDGVTLRYVATSNLYLCYTWLQYLLDHFLKPWNYQLNGEIRWQGDNEADRGQIIVRANTIEHQLEQNNGEKDIARPDELIYCVHQNAQQTRLVCAHLAGQDPEEAYYRWFTGQGLNFHLVCAPCCKLLKEGAADVQLRQICWRCSDELQGEGGWEGIVGQPEIRTHSTPFFIFRRNIPLPPATQFLAIEPVEMQKESMWIALTSHGELVGFNFTANTVQSLMHLPPSRLDLTQEISLHLSLEGQFAAVANTKGQYGIVLNLATGEVTMQLQRDTYHIEHSHFPLAFFQCEDRPLLVHGTAWNRLDISNPRTGELMSIRSDPPYQRRRPDSEHYLDYFHCALSVSPNQQWIADNGWRWSPVGGVVTWNLQRWVGENVWESEDGSSRKTLCQRWYYWDGPMCWINEQTLAVWGYGEDDEWLIPAVRIFEVISGKELHWFPGPEGTLIFDEYLFSFSQDHGTSAWDILTGERVLSDPNFHPTHYHRGAKQFLYLDEQNGTVVLGTFTQ